MQNQLAYLFMYHTQCMVHSTHYQWICCIVLDSYRQCHVGNIYWWISRCVVSCVHAVRTCASKCTGPMCRFNGNLSQMSVFYFLVNFCFCFLSFFLSSSSSSFESGNLYTSHQLWETCNEIEYAFDWMFSCVQKAILEPP